MIRKLVATALVMVLCAQCFYKLACITYYQLNKDYIAAFLCENRDNPITICYGQCFLKKALGFESGTNPNSFSSSLKFELPLFTVGEILKKVIEQDVLADHSSSYTLSRPVSLHFSIFHPPSFVC